MRRCSECETEMERFGMGSARPPEGGDSVHVTSFRCPGCGHTELDPDLRAQARAARGEEVEALREEVAAELDKLVIGAVGDAVARIHLAEYVRGHVERLNAGPSELRVRFAYMLMAGLEDPPSYETASKYVEDATFFAERFEGGVPVLGINARVVRPVEMIRFTVTVRE